MISDEPMSDQKINPTTYPDGQLWIPDSFKINFLSAFLLWIVASSLSAADWPMWRYDAEHRAASPENLPDTAQGIFVATSPDGLEWSTSGVSISPDTASYLDPTGIKNADGSFTLVLAVAPNEMGMRDYDLQHTRLSVIIP